MKGRSPLVLTSALVVVVLGFLIYQVATSDLSDPDSDPVASMELLRDEGILFLDEHHVYLVYNEGDPLALSDNTQHLGSEVTQWCESSQMFETPTHGEKFDTHGYYYGGPAKRGLDRYPVRLEGDAIYVDLENPIQGPERGEGPKFQPQGPFCVPM